jgi:hypothetical protein
VRQRKRSCHGGHSIYGRPAAREGLQRLGEADIRKACKIEVPPLRGDAERPVLNAMLRKHRNAAYCSMAMVVWETWLNVVIDLALAE